MAQTIESLFGLTPDAIRAQQAAQLNQQATAYAQLNPLQAARAGLFRAGSQLGSGIAGALGYQDPEILRAQQRQRMLTELDTSTPESLLQAAQTAQRSGEFALAQGLQSQAMEMAKRGAEIGKLAAETQRAQRETDPIQELAKTGKYSTASLAKYAKTRDVADLELTSPMTPTEIERLQAYRDTLTDPKKIAEVNAAIEGASKGRGTTVSVGVSPVLKQATGVTGLVQDFENLTKVPRETLGLAQSAQSLINEARKANNSQAWEAARTTLAKAIGEGKLSNEDIRRTGNDPRLIQGALDWVNRKVEGVPNESIMQQLYATAKLLERISTQRIEASTGRVKKIAELEGIPQEQLPVLFPSVQNPAAGSAGVVDWNNLK